MNHSEMNPELSPEEVRARIDATVEQLKNDTNPDAPKSDKAQEAAAQYVAEEGPELAERIAAEHAALQEARDAVGAEYANEVKNKLELAYDEAMTEVLFNAGLTIKSERGQKMAAAKAETIKTVMAKIAAEKPSQDKVVPTLMELLPELVPEFKEAGA